MKNFLQNLLIVFALALCALIAFQWVRETDLRKQVQELANTIQNKTEAGRSLEATLKHSEAEIQRLDALKNQLAANAKSNQLQISALNRELEKTTNELARVTAQMETHREALQQANDRIHKQNEDIQRQNEELKALAEERNEVVNKFNKLAADFNDLVDKWNKQQETLARSATNAPAPK